MCQGLQEITSRISVRGHRREMYVYYDALMFMIYYTAAWHWTFLWMWAVKVLCCTAAFLFFCTSSQTLKDYCAALMAHSFHRIVSRWRRSRVSDKETRRALLISLMCFPAHSAAQRRGRRRSGGGTPLLLLYGPRDTHQPQLHHQRQSRLPLIKQ